MTLTQNIIKLATPIVFKKLSNLSFKDFQKPVKQALFNLSKDYINHYIQRHCQIQVLGMSIPFQLNDIYIKVLLLEPEFLKSLDSIQNLEFRYKTSKKRNFLNNDLPKLDGLDIANCEQFICVLGNPGVGKTTYLKKIGLESLLSFEGSYKHEKIPVFVDLKNLPKNDFNIELVISKEFEICGFPNSIYFTEKALKSGDLLILLDGLDEVPTPSLGEIIKSIKDLSNKYNQNRFMISCRTAAYHTYLNGFKTVMIAEFDRDQIYSFIRNWFQADSNPNLTPKLKEENISKCWQELNDINSIGTEELSHTPLLLTFICLVYSRNRTISENRSTLYSKALDILLDEWAKEKCLEENWGEYEQKILMKHEKGMLSKIAYQSFIEDRLFFEKDKLLQDISDFLKDNTNCKVNLEASCVLDAIVIQQGILVERAPNIFSFSHLTLQEYLCALHIRDFCYQDYLLREYSLDERWKEIFLLVVGLMDSASIKFLELFNRHTQINASEKKLGLILTWANNKAQESENELPSELNRLYLVIFILGMSIIIMLDSSFICELKDVSSEQISISSSLSLILDLSIDLLNSLDTSHQLLTNLEIKYPQEIKYFKAKIINPSRIFSIHKVILELGIFSKNKINNIINTIDTYFISDDENSLSIFIESMCGILDIPIDTIYLTEFDMQTIINYLKTYQLMIRCKNESSIPSHNSQWIQVQKKMFLPLQT